MVNLGAARRRHRHSEDLVHQTNRRLQQPHQHRCLALPLRLRQAATASVTQQLPLALRRLPRALAQVQVVPGLFGSKPAEGQAKPSGFNFGQTSGGGFNFGKSLEQPSKPADDTASTGFSFGGRLGGVPSKPAGLTTNAGSSVTSSSGSEQKPVFSFPGSSPATISAQETSQQAGSIFPVATSATSSAPDDTQAKSQQMFPPKQRFEGFGRQPTKQDGPQSPALPKTGPESQKGLFSGLGGEGGLGNGRAPVSASSTPAATAAAPTSTSTSFFTPATTSQTVTTSVPAPGAISFGKPPATSEPASTAGPASNSFSLSNLLNTTAASQPATTSAAPASNPFPGFGPTSTSSTSQPATTASAPTAGTGAPPKEPVSGVNNGTHSPCAITTSQ